MKKATIIVCWTLLASLLNGPMLGADEGDTPPKDARSDSKGSKKGKKGKKPMTLEERIEELEDEVKDLQKDLNKSERGLFSDGIVTLGGGAELKFGGKLELLLIDSDDDSVPALGPTFETDEPDPHLVLQRLRLEPILRLNRHVSLRGQLDFRPTDGDTELREATARHDSQPLEWMRSRFQIGLDDRFIRPARRTKGYPLIGNAFWRTESTAITWALTFGHRKGLAAARASAAKGPRNVTRASAATDSFDDDFDTDDSSTIDSGAPQNPFDFVNNWGQLQLILSVGQGYELDSNEVNFDNARFNNLVQDDRELETDLALREIGIGLGWRRDFQHLGDLGILGFLYDDELRASSIEFLQGPEMTQRTPGNIPVAGYGDSEDDTSLRYGVTVEYFLPASTIFEYADTRKRDGLRLLCQWIRGEDGALTREGFFVQGSYRFSFGKLVADRYFRSLEPIVRYGRMNVSTPLGPSPGLPTTWDRDEVMVGALVEVTSEVFVKIEYSMNGEESGMPDVANNELLVQLLVSLD